MGLGLDVYMQGTCHFFFSFFAFSLLSSSLSWQLALGNWLAGVLWWFVVQDRTVLCVRRRYTTLHEIYEIHEIHEILHEMDQWVGSAVQWGYGRGSEVNFD